MEFAVRDHLRIGFIGVVWDLDWGFGGNIAETCVLIKVSPKRVARCLKDFIACGNPRSALNQVVLGIEGRRRKIVIERVHFETGEPADGRFRVLPDVSKI